MWKHILRDEATRFLPLGLPAFAVGHLGVPPQRGEPESLGGAS